MRIVLRLAYAVKVLAALLFVAFGLLPSAFGAEAAAAVSRQVWQLLDYVAFDYSGAVSNGSVTQESEFAEMREFTATIVAGLAELPEQPGKAGLLNKARTLEEAVARKAAAKEVALLAHELADRLLVAYPFEASPTKLPDLSRGAQLFAATCASCHGATGAGDGPLAANLHPRPVAFVDRERARERSLLALYQAVSQGVQGTAMPAFKALADEDRWAVAFFAGNLSSDAASQERGAQVWRGDPSLRARLADLGTLSRLSEASLAASVGEQKARDVTAFLRSQPGAVAQVKQGGTGFVRARLSESVAAFRAGDRAEASRLALSAYLDGFEPLEPTLGARDRALLTDVEAAMIDFRSGLAGGVVAKVEADARRIDALLDRVDQELAFAASDATTTFVGAMTILLREGIEALLVVVGMIAFLRKAERPDMLKQIHIGWVSALAAGGMTWFVATYLVGISGASRELTEGASSLFAAVVLLGVGLWMHQKSTAGRWQSYLRDKLSTAMNRRSAFALALLAFVAVYREVFETVLFFSALWTEGNGFALVAGIVAGAALLGLLAWVLLRTSARMPIGRFFGASSVLVAILAFVLAGKGVKALQEAGVFAASPMAFPRIEWLGIFPTDQTLLAQLAVVAVAALGFWLNARPKARAEG